MLSVSEENITAEDHLSVSPFKIHLDTALNQHVSTQVIKIWYYLYIQGVDKHSSNGKLGEEAFRMPVQLL